MILSCEGISLSYGSEPLLEDISFFINEGDKLGIVGVNGAGKSTLLKIITGETESLSGNVYISKGKSIGYLAQNSTFSENQSVFETVCSVFSPLIEREKKLEELRVKAERGENEAVLQYSAENEEFVRLGGLEFRGRCRGMLISLGFEREIFDMPVNSLSGGQKTRVALAALLLSEPDIIILDEPTNHLDIESVIFLEKYLASIKKTVIVVSHDRYFLVKITNKTLEIENHRCKLYNGNYDFYAEQKKKDRETLLHQYKNQQKEIARIEAYIRQQRQWNRERNIIAAESRQKLLDKMEKIEAPLPDPANIRMTFTKSEESGNDVLSVRNLSKAYGNNILFSNLSFELKKRDRMVIIGHNGCGKSTLLKILNMAITANSGRFEYGYNVKQGYYDQENQNLNENYTVIEEIWNRYPDKTQTEIRSALALFLFRGEEIFKQISVLSGGEKARVTFAKLMLSKFNLLFLDEPTNHLDIMSREVLEDALLKFDGTIVAVSHDRYFIKKLATRILSFEKDNTVLDYLGTYDEYLSYSEKKSDQAKESLEKEKQSEAKLQWENMKKLQAGKRKNERLITKSKEEMSAIEARINEISKEEEKFSTNHIKLLELYNERTALENRMLELMEFFEKCGEEY